MTQVNDTSRPILAVRRPTEDPVNTNSSNEADTRLSAVQSSAGQLISPPPSRPATPELPPVPPPSPTFETRTAFLSRPCIPNYALYRAAHAPNGETRNGQGDKSSAK